jgi:hypothetical protein
LGTGVKFRLLSAAGSQVVQVDRLPEQRNLQLPFHAKTLVALDLGGDGAELGREQLAALLFSVEGGLSCGGDFLGGFCGIITAK